MKLERLSRLDGTWDTLRKQWTEQCSTYEEDFEVYAAASVRTLEEECDKTSAISISDVFGLRDEKGVYHAACFLNAAYIKGYNERVLRVRHVVLSPYYDFEDIEIDEYAVVLAQIFTGILRLSNTDMMCPHIKIHYRSPYDRQFFTVFSLPMKESATFSSVESKGMWLHLTKA